jgi:MoaA/NifB/PqqE/SkfB family radical SAM enzyme
MFKEEYMDNTGFSEITEERLNYKGKDPWYCEIALTGKCNFSCKYCNRFKAEIDFEKLKEFINFVRQFKHIQITGGEPTIHPKFFEIIDLCRSKTLRLGLSTNGTFGIDNYKRCNVDIFSISLDDYDFDILRNRGYKNPEMIVGTIKELSKSYYVNIGIVIDELNVDRLEGIVDYVLQLGVSDIKLSAIRNTMPKFTKTYDKYPILSYRVKRFNNGIQMRGTPLCKTCGIIKNDVTIVGDKHYPCLVYFREGGKEIGGLSSKIMQEREDWSINHNCINDPICKKFCMDFKCEFNNALSLLI